MASIRVRIYNDIDATSYEIVYHLKSVESLHISTKENIMDKILNRITKDVIRISLDNKIRSSGLNFDDIQVDINKDQTEFRFYNATLKNPNGYLHTCCTHCIAI